MYSSTRFITITVVQMRVRQSKSVLVLFNDSDDASCLAFDLDGQSTDGDGRSVLCGGAANVAAEQPQVNERGGGDGTGHSNQRCPNGEGGARNTDTYIQTVPTPGTVNDCPAPFTTIYDIQYTTDPSGDSPFTGQSGITTEGIVTAVFYNGCFIEDSAGGVWNGVFVYDSNTPVPGDQKRISGLLLDIIDIHVGVPRVDVH